VDAQDLLGVAEGVPRIRSDSQSSLALVRNPVVSQRSKHIDMLHHFVRERSDLGEIVLEYCSTERMVADSLTKVVGSRKFDWCRESKGVVSCKTGLSGSVEGQTCLTLEVTTGRGCVSAQPRAVGQYAQ
jgi:hypothetical protein